MQCKEIQRWFIVKPIFLGKILRVENHFKNFQSFFLLRDLKDLTVDDETIYCLKSHSQNDKNCYSSLDHKLCSLEYEVTKIEDIDHNNFKNDVWDSDDEGYPEKASEKWNDSVSISFWKNINLNSRAQ